MTLAQLITEIPCLLETRGDMGLTIRALQSDSRLVEPGDCFVALRGELADGHQYIAKAIEKGAVAVVCEYAPDTDAVAIIRVESSAEALGFMASAFYQHPSRRLRVVGVTGTNGKTTVTTLLWQCFTRLGFRCGLAGTVENRVGERVVPSTHTTPDALNLQRLFAQMLEEGCEYAFIEVSSHAIVQHRATGTVFSGAVFTNLTHDHLDYHGSFAHYRDAKKTLFDRLPATAFSLVNADDRNGAFMQQNTPARRVSFALKNTATYKGKILDNALTGLHLRIDDEEVHARLIGEFNASNLMAVYGVARELGVENHQALVAVSGLTGAEGRFDYVSHGGVLGIVDYAHTPDALQQVLETIEKLKKKGAKVIVITGAGGDRDKTKRPIMAQISARLGDQLILTSDNPRTESPSAILADMEAGLDAEAKMKTLTIENREQAIKTAVALAKSGDIILLAGKGHEKYQDINGVKHPFDDKAILNKYLSGAK